MNDKQLKLIYEDMGWLVSSKDGCPQVYESDEWQKLLHWRYRNKKYPDDSNFAWEITQEIVKQGDMKEFDSKLLADWLVVNNSISFSEWLLNPENFFNCFVKWLEEKKKGNKNDY